MPQSVRTKLGLLPHTEVEFEVVGDYARIRRVSPKQGISRRAKMAIEPLRGTFDNRLSTEEIMALMRGPSADAELKSKKRR